MTQPHLAPAPRATDDVWSVQLRLPQSVYIQLEQAAAQAGCAVDTFILGAAQAHADRRLLLDELARQRAAQDPLVPRRARPLSKRETEVLTLLGKGCTIAEVASVMQIRWFTVADHIKVIYRKLGVTNRAQAVLMAARMGLIT